jgi:hypothetical protein
VDTVAVTWECDSFDVSGARWHGRKRGPVPKYSLERGGFLVGVRPGVAVLELSVPRRLRGENSVLATPEEVLVAVAEVFDECCLRAPPAGTPVDLESLALTRLDLTLDLQPVPDVPRVLDALARAPRLGRVPVRTFSRGGMMESLVVGPVKRWSVSAYDKTRSEKTKPGTLRTEARFRRKGLQNRWVREAAHIDVLGDLINVDLERLHRAAIERAGLDVTVTDVDVLQEVVFERSGLAPAAAAMVWTILTSPGFFASLGRSAQSRYRPIVANLNVALAATSPGDWRLDFDSGRLLTSASTRLT